MAKALRRSFRVASLERVGTIAQDLDVGVVRVSGALLRELGGRDSLVKITANPDGSDRPSMVRILRAATGTRALAKTEIALQYDDRRKLGIKRAGATCDIELRPVGRWLSLPSFLLGHSSPLVRMEASYALSLMVVGGIIGLVVGAILGATFEFGFR